jgi:DNA-binding transcriptional LysR family regulator
LTLTAEGKTLFDKVVPLLRQLDTSDEVASDSGSLAGRIKFSMPSELGQFLLTPVFRDFAPQFPAINLIAGLADRHVDLIREDYDVVFRVGGTGQGELRVRKLADVTMAIVASPSFVERHGIPMSADAASKLEFVRYTVQGKPSSILFADGESFTPQGRVECDTGQALRAATLHGLGAAFFMRCAVHKEIEDGCLIDISASLSLAKQPFNLIHAFGSMMPNRLRRFCDFIQENTKAIPGL